MRIAGWRRLRPPHVPAHGQDCWPCPQAQPGAAEPAKKGSRTTACNACCSTPRCGACRRPLRAGPWSCCAPDLLRIDADAQREAAGIGPPAVVPAEVPAEQAPADITAPDTAPAGTPADKGVGLAVSGPPDIVPAIVPDQQPTAGMASQDEVRALPAVQRALPLAPEKYVPVPWSTLGFVKFTVAKASVDGSKASGRIGARRWTVPDIAHMHA